MAGAGLIGIKRRIKSITNTKKITKAMGLVATAKLRKCREKLDFNSKYYNAYEDVIEKVLNNIEDYNIYRDGNGSKNNLYIIITSDSGLCGSYNGTVFKKAIELIGDDKNSKLLVIGGKGVSFFRKTKYEIVSEFVEISDIPTFKEAKAIADTVINLYTKGEVGEVNVIYTEYVSSVKQEVNINKLLPLHSVNDGKHSFEDIFTFEPFSSAILDSIINSYFVEKVLFLLINSKSSEQSIRMSAMDGATKNANELLEKLKLKFNRMRQGAITQEISEIVGGAEAQK